MPARYGVKRFHSLTAYIRRHKQLVVLVHHYITLHYIGNYYTPITIVTVQ